MSFNYWEPTFYIGTFEFNLVFYNQTTRVWKLACASLAEWLRHQTSVETIVDPNRQPMESAGVGSNPIVVA